VDKIIARKRWFFLFSLILTVPGLFFILATPFSNGAIGLRFSIDFTGGTAWEFRPAAGATTEAVRLAVVDAGHPEAIVSETETGYFIVKVKPLDLQQGGGGANAGAELAALRTAVAASTGTIVDEGSVTTVGPVVSKDLTQQAALLVVLGSVGILLWMTYRFRNLRFGLAALVALLHDVIVTVGFFAIAGTVAGVEVDALFVTAMLTVIGFSVHDTIVVFDRIRENLARHAGAPFAEIVNHSIVQTLGRSFNTTATVLITLLSLLLFAGGAVRTFVLALFIGILSGTYSSIFNASPLLVWWEERSQARRAAASTKRAA